MSYMCVMSTSLYGCKECDDCGKCEHRYDEWDEPYDEDEEYLNYCEKEETDG